MKLEQRTSSYRITPLIIDSWIQAKLNISFRVIIFAYRIFVGNKS